MGDKTGVEVTGNYEFGEILNGAVTKTMTVKEGGALAVQSAQALANNFVVEEGVLALGTTARTADARDALGKYNEKAGLYLSGTVDLASAKINVGNVAADVTTNVNLGSNGTLIVDATAAHEEAPATTVTGTINAVEGSTLHYMNVADQGIVIVDVDGKVKTTVANLAMRFYDATSGSVRVFGHDVRELRQRDLRQIVGLVEQGPRLFSGTIGSNLRWGRADATDDELAAAVGCAQADDVVASKPEGLAARVEQYGRNFSGGQRQRLAIARPVVRRPRVLVLDDASSALDFATDAALRRSVRREFAGDCVITISQRVTAMRGADRILVLDSGRVAGLGTHDELLRDCGVYREICESQLTEEEVSR